MKKNVFGLGSAQVLVTTVVAGILARFIARQPCPAALIIGNGLALSSTAVVLQRSNSLATIEGYCGYGAEQGEKLLRATIASTFYANLGIEDDDVFISDGAKSDISRLQVLFGSDVTMAVQDPSYPAYVDSGVIMGQTGRYQNNVGYQNIEYMKCTPENGFFPDLSAVFRMDVIFFCSPNNPTGSAASRDQLTQLVQFAKDNGTIIIYDSAYALSMSNDTPKSIFEIPGAKEVAIEISSFSKYAGFTGVRLGWRVIPKELQFSDGSPVAKDFNCIVFTCFNGDSNIAQAGEEKIFWKIFVYFWCDGKCKYAENVFHCLPANELIMATEAMQDVIGFYKEDTRIIVEMFQSLGFNVYGGKNGPYVWFTFLAKVRGTCLVRFLRRLMSLQLLAVGLDQVVKASLGLVPLAIGPMR